MKNAEKVIQLLVKDGGRTFIDERTQVLQILADSARTPREQVLDAGEVIVDLAHRTRYGKAIPSSTDFVVDLSSMIAAVYYALPGEGGLLMDQLLQIKSEKAVLGSLTVPTCVQSEYFQAVILGFMRGLYMDPAPGSLTMSLFERLLARSEPSLPRGCEGILSDSVAGFVYNPNNPLGLKELFRFLVQKGDRYHLNAFARQVLHELTIKFVVKMDLFDRIMMINNDFCLRERIKPTTAE